MSTRSLSRLLAAAALFALVLAVVTWRLERHLHVLGSEQDADRFGMIDFRDVIYFPTRAVLEGVNPYDSVGNTFPVYSPWLIALDSPLQLLPYRGAMLVYGIFNLILLFIVAKLALTVSNVRSGIAGTILLATLMLISRPGQSNFYYGQLALPMVLCAVVATEYSAKKPLVAALALALSTIKPTFGAPLLILLFSHRRYKATIS
jgi:hypothetical protein